MSALLAINWQPELRGILIVIIAVTVLCGSLFMILSTNLGVRLGFLVALAGLFAWMFLMGAIWWSYGKGLLGKEIRGRTPQTSAELAALIGRRPHQRHVGVVTMESAVAEFSGDGLDRAEVDHIEGTNRENLGDPHFGGSREPIRSRGEDAAHQFIGEFSRGQVENAGDLAIANQ